MKQQYTFQTKWGVLLGMGAKWLYILAGLLLGQSVFLYAQETPNYKPDTYGKNDTIVVYATVMDDGTLVPTGVLPDVTCVGKMKAYWRKKAKEWTRLRKAVYVTYPYALQASKAINTINRQLEGVTDKSARKKIINQHEAALKSGFSDQLTKLSVYQGMVLMKLINRQTGDNCYEIIKEYKGGVNARFWQTVAYVFGSTLKQPYDAKGIDLEMEGYVHEISPFYPQG